MSHNSYVQYIEPFDSTRREVLLSGEAYFEVAKDASRPFIVKAGTISTEVLGTSFNINARDEQSTVRVSLTSGSIKIKQDDWDTMLPGGQITLEPGEQLSFNVNNQELKVDDFNLNEVMAWIKGIILFRNTARREVISTLEQWYGVNISENNRKNRQWKLTAKYDNRSLEKILTSIGFVNDFKFDIKDNEVVITYY